MKVFFDRQFPCNLIEVADAATIQHFSLFDQVCYNPDPDTLSEIQGNALLLHASVAVLDALISGVLNHTLQAKSYTLAVDDKEYMSYTFLKQFHLVRAGGGVVKKPKTNEILCIYRKGYWDLPKGTMENKERKVFTAKREVEEECNVQVQCREKITTTYHVMPMHSGQHRLKQTTWFVMYAIDDHAMRPQTSEGIEEVRWMSMEEALDKAASSYLSIQHVLHAFLVKEAL